MRRALIAAAVFLGLVGTSGAAAPDLNDNVYIVAYRAESAAATAKYAQFFAGLNMSKETREATIMTSFGISEDAQWPMLRVEDYVAMVTEKMGPDRLLSLTVDDPTVFGFRVILKDKTEFDVYFKRELGVATVLSATMSQFGRKSDATPDEKRGIMMMLAGFEPAKLASTLSAGGGVPADRPYDNLVAMFSARWKNDAGGSCFIKDDDIGVNIAEGVAVQYESGCTISDTKRDGYDVVAKLTCGGEGEEWSGSLRMKDHDREHLAWTHIDEDGKQEYKLTRCY